MSCIVFMLHMEEILWIYIIIVSRKSISVSNNEVDIILFYIKWKFNSIGYEQPQNIFMLITNAMCQFDIKHGNSHTDGIHIGL